MNKKKSFTERERQDKEGSFMDNPEHLKTDKESIYDMHEDMKFVDPIPLEDLKMEEREEKIHHDTKSRSSSEDKYQNRKK